MRNFFLTYVITYVILVIRIKLRKEAVVMDMITPTKARTNLFSLIKETNRDSAPIFISGADTSKSAVLIGKKDYDALQETLALFMNGQMPTAFSREEDESIDLDTMIAEIDNE
ncbi:type II toxin-antitoxin system Phd/YefM family antitoxin [Weissella thailandensis]|uniref:Antitoxin n=2 Tax=Weissella thailandensis TaxID=89061 RepID=A0ABX9I3Y5_9LACO|nr:type II toxin-antitoxin system Phd/YefM family antitoxin [Weissella thailandensis]RDS59420.1 type II toxin-antitoxin system Phd/YefM family antitoxin [Weissella thailandensis]